MNTGIFNIMEPSSNRSIGYLRELLNESITNKTRLEAEIKVMDAIMGDTENLSENESQRYQAMINARESLDKLISFVSGIML